MSERSSSSSKNRRDLVLARLLWLTLALGACALLLGWLDEALGFLPRLQTVTSGREWLYRAALATSALSVVAGLALRFAAPRRRWTIFWVLGLLLALLGLLTQLVNQLGIVSFG